MMSLTFDKRNARDHLEDFRKKVRAFKSDALNQSLAGDCAVAGWSLCDWVFPELNGYINLRALQNEVNDMCHELCLLQDLANASKHREINRYTPLLQEAKHHRGAFSQGFDRGFDISRLLLVDAKGKEYWVEDVFNACLNFWDDFFAQHGLMDT